MGIPHAAILKDSASTIFWISPGRAPSATRNPISRVLRETAYWITPNRPAPVSRKPKTPRAVAVPAANRSGADYPLHVVLESGLKHHSRARVEPCQLLSYNRSQSVRISGSLDH